MGGVGGWILEDELKVRTHQGGVDLKGGVEFSILYGTWSSLT